MTPAELLRVARRAARLTQTQLAAEIGVSAWWVGQWEQGLKPIPPGSMSRLNEVLGPLESHRPPEPSLALARVAADDHASRLLARKAAEKQEWLEQVRIQHEADRARRRVG